jgi:hypothetical protein
MQSRPAALEMFGLGAMLPDEAVGDEREFPRLR